MSRFHQALLAGHEPAAALAVAAITDDERLDPTACAFVALAPDRTRTGGADRVYQRAAGPTLVT